MLAMKRPQFTPKWTQLCLCGSGRTYRNCCWQRLPGSAIGNQYTAAIGEDSPERAIVACRADIVQYTIWHKSHTEPVLFRGAPVDGLLRIDIDALAAYVERLFWLYSHTGRAADWLPVLERLRINIRHPKWERKINYFRALWFLTAQSDRTAARQELARVGLITADEDDVDLLQLYVDVGSDNMSFAERIKFLDRILQVSNSRSDQLQYRGAKAVQYFLIADNATSQDELDEAIRIARESESEEPFNSYERHMLGRLLQMLASLRNDRGLFTEALGHFHTLLLENGWTRSGRAMLYREIGDCHRYAGSWSEAEQDYRQASGLVDDPLDRIYCAQALLYQKRIHEAGSKIREVDRDALGRHEFVDYVFVFAAIAIWSGEKSTLGEAKMLLDNLITSEPYFNERRLTLLLGTTNALASGTVSEAAKAESTPEGGIASATSNFFILQPNFMGIGLNLNAILSYLLNKKPR